MKKYELKITKFFKRAVALRTKKNAVQKKEDRALSAIAKARDGHEAKRVPHTQAWD